MVLSKVHWHLENIAVSFGSVEFSSNLINNQTRLEFSLPSDAELDVSLGTLCLRNKAPRVEGRDTEAKEMGLPKGNKNSCDCVRFQAKPTAESEDYRPQVSYFIPAQGWRLV